jgi:hypothetical protein
MSLLFCAIFYRSGLFFLGVVAVVALPVEKLPASSDHPETGIAWMAVELLKNAEFSSGFV